jgi:phospho-acceptor domain-containing protein
LVVVHDVRNHLAPLRGRLDLLKRRALRAGHEEHARDATAAVVAVDRLGRLVDDLLDAERLEHGLFNLRPEAVDLVALVTEVTRDFATERVGIEVRAPEELWLPADARHVRQSLERRSGVEGARVSIEDEGPGVPSWCRVCSSDSREAVRRRGWGSVYFSPPASPRLVADHSPSTPPRAVQHASRCGCQWRPHSHSTQFRRRSKAPTSTPAAAAASGIAIPRAVDPS